MKRLLQLTFALALLAAIAPSRSYGQVDSVFWFAAPWVTPGHADNVPVVLRFSTFNSPTTVRIQQPAGTYDTTFTIAPNSLFSKTLSHIIGTLESKPANTALNYGLKITADTVMTVVYEVVTNVNNPETYSLKGQNGMGTEFVTPFQTRWNNGSYSPQPKSMICIVATQNNTTVYITPRCAIIGHPAGVTYSVVLQAGQTYTCENVTPNTATPGNNLSGTIVVSDKPVSVTVSDDSVAAENGGCRDLMGDQLVPVDIVGTEYIINKGNMNASAMEGVYLVATENFTTISINNGVTTTSALINRGDTYYYNITQPLTYITADKAIYTLQASGFGCELGEAIIPPINCAGSSQVSFVRTNSQTFILNLLCRSSATGSFVLNGSSTLIPASAFSFVPGTGNEWSGAQISFSTGSIPAGTANLITNSADVFAMGVINGGSTSGCLYHYLSSFIRRVEVEVGNDTTLCNGDPFVILEGEVREGATTGIWTVLDGTGTITDPTDLTTTYQPSQADYDQGSLTFVLTSTGNCDPVSDTMKVTFISSPVVLAGTDDTYCKNNVGEIPLSGNVSFAAAAVWSGGNGGAFENSGDLATTYSPSPADLAADSVALFLTSQGSFFACPSDQDTVVIYFTNPPVVVAGPDQNVCSNTALAELDGTVTGSSTTGIWTSTGSGAFSPSQNQLSTDYLISPADTTAGVVMLYLTSTNNGNCLAVTDSLQLSIFSKPEIEITTADSICSNAPAINLTGTVSTGFSVIWSVNGSGTITDPSDLDTYYNISPIDTLNETILVVLSTTASICPVESDSLEITFVNPPIVTAGLDQSSCNNAPVQLNGSISGPNSSGSWSTLGTGTFNPGPNFLATNYFPSAADVAFGSVRLVLTTSGAFGCAPETDTVLIVFKPSPEADFDASTSCANENTQFTDQSTSTDGTISQWFWNFGDNTTSIAQNPQHNFPFPGDFNTQLIVTSTNGCSDTITQQVTVLPVPVPSFTSSVGCENNPIQFNDNSFISSGTITEWEYDFGGGFTSTDENAVYTYPTSGTFPVTLTVTSALGCSASVTTQVVVQQSPTADFTVNPNPALVLTPVNFTDESFGDNPLVSWYWDFGDGEADNAQNTVHSYETGGDYPVTLTVTDDIGCQGVKTITVSLSLLPVLPTGFTPNGDGENDVFIIRGGPFQTVDFKIYNNWGELIFSTNELNTGWDGTYKGEAVPIGVYTWTFVVNVADGKVFRESGDVTLMR
jgi:gliding motility-associated-like protein